MRAHAAQVLLSGAEECVASQDEYRAQGQRIVQVRLPAALLRGVGSATGRRAQRWQNGRMLRLGQLL